MEKCNVETDIQSFIAAKGTGTDIPATLSYRNYYQGDIARAESLPPIAGLGLSNRVVVTPTTDSPIVATDAPLPPEPVEATNPFYTPVEPVSTNPFAQDEGTPKAPRRRMSEQGEPTVPQVIPTTPTTTVNTDELPLYKGTLINR